MKPATKRKPRLSPALRTRIVQLRASKSDHPPSLDDILNALQQERDPQDNSKPLWDPLPSRGSVQNIVRSWHDLDEEVRQRDLPFKWHELEKACIPWEASSWVQSCLQTYELAKIPSNYAGLGEFLNRLVVRLVTPFVFTNRWAKWCWRIHEAVPTYETLLVLLLAREYTLAEQERDLLPDHPEMAVEGLTSFLRWFPDLNAPELNSDQYQEAVQLGVIQAVQALEPGESFDFRNIFDELSSRAELGVDILIKDHAHSSQTIASLLIRLAFYGYGNYRGGSEK